MSDKDILYHGLIHRIRAARKKEFFIRSGAVILSFLSSVFVTILLFSIIEYFANGDIPFRTTLMIVAVLINTAVLAILSKGLVPDYLGRNRITVETFALRVGTYFKDIRDNLCNAIQLYSGFKNDVLMSKELAVAAFDDVYIKTSDKNFEDIIDQKDFKRSVVMFFVSLLTVLAIFAAFNESLGNSLYRLINFNQSFAPPAPFEISILPIDQKVLKGENTEIQVLLKGNAPNDIILKLKEDTQEEFDSFILREDSLGYFKFHLPSLKKSVEFYAESNWMGSSVSTKTGKITVIDPPFLRSIDGLIVFPGYTDRSSIRFNESNADISALKGSSVQIDILSNKDLKSSTIVIISENSQAAIDSAESIIKFDTAFYKMAVDGRKASGKFRVQRNAVYYVDLTDVDGEINRNPVKYSIISGVDEFPEIQLIEPQTDVSIGENALMPALINIRDDYGFSKLVLNYRLAHSAFASPEENFKSKKIDIASKDSKSEIPYIWNLNELNISPEDKYEFYFEIFDNDIISGPKSSRTRTLTVRLPSLDEVMAETEYAQDKIEKDLEKVLKETQQLKKDMDEVNRELLKQSQKKEPDWKEKKKIQDIVKKQNELKNKLSDIQEDFKEMTDKLEKNNVLSEETLDKFRELQRLMQEVDSAELQQMQQKMDQMMQQVSQEDLKKAMEQMEFNEEKFRKSIERTLKILQRLKAEQKVDALSKKAQEMKEAQDELQKQTENTNPSDKEKTNELSKKQDALNKDLGEMEKELDDLKDLMKEIGEDMPMDAMEKAQESLKKEETSDQMQQASKQMQKGNMKQSSQAQQKASKNLQEFSEQMQEMKQQMEDKQTKEAIRKMQKAISDLLEISKEQEKIKQNTGESDYNSTRLPDYARDQADALESLSNVARGMMELSEKSFAITPEMGENVGNAMEQMQESVSQLAERRTSSAAKSQSDAMSSINKAVSQMQQMMSAMQNQGSGACNNPGGSGQGQGQGGMGMGQQLQKLAAQQQGINQAMQQMMQSGSNGQMNMKQQAEYGRLSDEQGRAQKSLQELAKEQKEIAGGDKQKPLGNLEKIAEEMKEVVSDIESGKITNETLKRQERILSRLLDASRSIHDRDYEKKRESKSGKKYSLESPGPLDLKSQEGRQRAMDDMLKSLQKGYTKDYEALIRSYFEVLKKGDKVPVQ